MFPLDSQSITRHSVPFFPFEIRNLERERGYILDHPVSGKHYEINFVAFEVLRLCNGVATYEEIVQELNRRHHIGGTEIRNRCAPLLRTLERDGLLWWRTDRMQVASVGPPQFVLWNMTDRCNHRCQHCVIDASTALPDELSTLEGMRLLDELASFGTRSLVLSGGEPLIRRDFFEIAAHAHRNGMTFQLATNATFVTERVANKIAAFSASAQVSLDGSTPSIHDSFRGCPGAWKRTVRGIKNLVKTGTHVMLASTITKKNIDDIPRLYKLAGDLGVKVFRILPFVPFGRGARARMLEVQADKMKEVTIWLHRQHCRGGLPVAPMEFQCLLAPIDGKDSKNGSWRIGCDGAVAYCTVTSSGDVLPCNFFKGVRVHNVRRSPFHWIWDNCHFLQYFRSLTVNDIHGACHRCEWLSQCRGSCIAVNFVHGDLFQSNRHCWYARELERDGSANAAL